MKRSAYFVYNYLKNGRSSVITIQSEVISLFTPDYPACIVLSVFQTRFAVSVDYPCFNSQ